VITRIATVALTATGMSRESARFQARSASSSAASSSCSRSPARADYAALLDVAGDYAVLELAVRTGEWIEGRTLRELGLRDEGIAVLGIQRAEDEVEDADRTLSRAG
jgi:Trk K+ transport system NAD-binding subunit